jgi:hypothetical protein
MSTTFGSISGEIVARMKELGRSRYGIVFDPPEGPNGTATGQTPLGECVIEFAHDSGRDELTLTVVKKPWLLPESLLWSGLQRTLDRCRHDDGN